MKRIARAPSSMAPLDALNAAPLARWLSPEARKAVAREMTLRRVDAGDVLTRENGPGLVLHAIAKGAAAFSSSSAEPAPLTAGELFGELASSESDGEKGAAVQALSPLEVWVLEQGSLSRLAAGEPEVGREFARFAENLRFVHLLKLTSPMQQLSWTRIQQLVARLPRRRIDPGTVVLERGKPVDEAYLLLRGRLRGQTEGGADPLDHPGEHIPGALVGETTLLADASSQATVIAREPSELLVVARSDLFELMAESPEFNRAVRALIVARARPRRRDEVLALHQDRGSGPTLTTLKDPERNAYFRLSPAGWRLWQQLDGDTPFEELARHYSRDESVPRPDRASRLLGQLMEAGFLENVSLRSDVPGIDSLDRAEWWPVRAMAKLATWRWVWRGADAAFGWLYRHGGAPLCTRPFAWLMGALGFVGLLLVGARAEQVITSLRQVPPAAWLLLVPMVFGQTLAHEIGHGLMTKRVGCRVNGAGVGWYWFTLIFFVDTSDSWVASRRSRIRITLAGPWTDLFVGGVCAVVASISSGFAAALWWQGALLSYLSFVGNLNPLMKFDGYYLLIDLLERPNLRAQSLQWLRRPTSFRGQWVEASYALGACVYLVATLALVLTSYRVFAADTVGQLVSPSIAVGLSWSLGIGVFLLTTAGLWAEMSQATSHAGR